MQLWQQDNYSEIEKQLDCCKKAIMFFDQIEEKRTLDGREFGLRQMIRERAFKLATIIELKWLQRSRCKWLAEGDNNTRYFHAFASTRLRGNLISSLTHDGHIYTRVQDIQMIFYQHMRQLLGTESEIQDFDASVLYQGSDLHTSEVPFTEYEIAGAVKSLAKNKSSGPDGIPNEFLQFFGLDVKNDIMALVHEFYNHRLDLNGINRANMVLIPKREMPSETKDYRPISIINLLPKLISKLLAMRLSTATPFDKPESDCICQEKTDF